MKIMSCLKGVFLLLCVNCVCYGQDFTIPPVVLEAYAPSGFRASIPALPGIELFAFHGRLGKPLTPIEPGDFSEDILKPSNDHFTYYNPNIKLRTGDVLHYWVFVQHNKLGYRRDAQKWTVGDIKAESTQRECQTSQTRVTNRTKVCKNSVVFEDKFSSTGLDETKWISENYIPTEPDYSFVIYKTNEVMLIENNKLSIGPRLIDEKELRTDINITSCTKSPGTPNCFGKLHIIQNPVVSGKITSTVAFTYGKFEIRARLPSGDWIIPEIYLEDENFRRILIAYSRGNKQLKGTDGRDIGGRLLFGGPVAKHSEPQRSSQLSSYQHKEPLAEDVHTYTMIWGPSQIELFLDGVKYGTINTEIGFTGQNAGKFRLVLGLGVGGLTDFPDDFTSGNSKKPWKNRSRTQVRDFFEAINIWYPTWSQSASQLQIEYVKVTAI